MPTIVRLRSSLVGRSLLSIFVLLLLIFTATAYIFIIQLKDIAYDQMKRQAHYISEITAEALDLPMWNLDTKQVQVQLDSLKESVSFCGARVRDAQGAVMAQTDFPSALEEEQFVMTTVIDTLNPNSDSTTEEMVGTLEVCTSRAPVQALLYTAVTQQIALFAVISLSVLVACYASLMILARPLNRIRLAMHKLAHTMQPITDPDLLKENEIGTLAHSFNEMTTDLKQNYNELTAAKEAAQSADRAKTTFLSNMTHELRTPLNSVIGMTNLLRERPLASDDKEMLNTVNQSAMMLLDIVNNILDISKIEAGAITLEHVGFDYTTIISNVINSLQYLADHKKIALNYTLENPIPFLKGDPLRVTQILTNLVSNALKYTSSGSVSVCVSSRPAAANSIELHCRIVDTGIGIAEEKIGSIFKKFTQADESIARRFGGTGLGLAITADLISLMKGRIGVESRPNHGTTFWFTIPFETCAKIESHEHEASLRHKQRQATGTWQPENTKILVAEDHLLNQAFIKRLLPKYGLNNFDIVENGKEVLDAIRAKQYDMVLMDCFMPEISGYDASRMIREQENATGLHLPIIAMTANAMVGEEERCREAGMDDYIAKPILEKDFILVLSQWIRFENIAPISEISTTGVHAVNLDILKTFSNGDPAIEKEFIAIFLQQSDKQIAALDTLCVDGHCQEWSEYAHALKGGAGGVGAIRLKELSAQAQSMVNAKASDRTALLNAIRTEYTEVKSHLKTLGYAT